MAQAEMASNRRLINLPPIFEIIKNIVEEDAQMINGRKQYSQRIREIAYTFAEIFLTNKYGSWQPKSDKPRIIDLGGDPGAITVLYWKSKAPNANITVVEANPATAKVMKKCVNRLGMENVDIINAAAASDDFGTIDLHLHQPGHGYHNQDHTRSDNAQEKSLIPVKKIKISNLIKADEKIDLLKMDIEGSEGEVIKDLDESGRLPSIHQILMEFHHDINNPSNSLINVIETLKRNGFKIRSISKRAGKGIKKETPISPEEAINIANGQEPMLFVIDACFLL